MLIDLLKATDNVKSYADTKVSAHQKGLEKTEIEFTPFMAKAKLQDE